MHVEGLDGSRNVKGKSGKWEAFATATIHFSDESPVPNTVVTGTWSQDASGTVSGSTNDAGTVTFGTKNLNGGSSVTFTVDNVTLDPHAYVPSDNHETSITVDKQ